jgi:hypothetical protein
MANCQFDHDSVRGKFCPQCGDKIKESKVTCGNGHPMMENSKFCGKCGERAGTPVTKCTNGHELKKGARFCGTCGETNKSVSKSDASLSSQAKSDEFTSQPRIQPRPIVRTAETFLNPNKTSPHLENVPIDAGFQIPQKKKNLGPIAAISFLAVVIVVILLGSISSSSEPVTVTVEMTLIDEENCFNPSWGYADIPGGQVVVDVDGMKYFGSYDLWGESTILGCKYTAKVRDVPSDGVNYSVGMASGRRGTIYSSRDDLVSSDWTFSLTLG